MTRIATKLSACGPSTICVDIEQTVPSIGTWSTAKTQIGNLWLDDDTVVVGISAGLPRIYTVSTNSYVSASTGTVKDDVDWIGKDPISGDLVMRSHTGPSYIYQYSTDGGMNWQKVVGGSQSNTVGNIVEVPSGLYASFYNYPVASVSKWDTTSKTFKSVYTNSNAPIDYIGSDGTTFVILIGLYYLLTGTSFETVTPKKTLPFRSQVVIPKGDTLITAWQGVVRRSKDEGTTFETVVLKDARPLVRIYHDPSSNKIVYFTNSYEVLVTTDGFDTYSPNGLIMSSTVSDTTSYNVQDTSMSPNGRNLWVGHLPSKRVRLFKNVNVPPCAPSVPSTFLPYP